MSEQAEYVAPRCVLVIVPHADDVDFGVAGSVARWIEEGAKVTYCVVTDNSAGSNDPDADLETLSQTREEEQRAAARVLGVTDLRFLGYPDGVLQPTLELRRDLTRLIREVKPDRVVCLDPSTLFAGDRYVNHPDHRASGEAAIYAVFPSAGTRPIFPELLDEGYEPHNVSELYMMLSNEPNTYVDISKWIDRKIEALLCHQSQVGPDVGDWIRERNREMGKAGGCEYAESFRVIRFDRRRRKEDQKEEGS